MYQRPKSCDWGVISVGKSGISVSEAMCLFSLTGIGRVHSHIRHSTSPVLVVSDRKVRTEVPAAAFLTSKGGAGHAKADGDDAAEAADRRIAGTSARCGLERTTPVSERIH